MSISDGCQSCPPGTYNDVQGAGAQSACIFCPGGTANGAAAGASLAACVPCAVGEYANGVGHASCERCARGTHGGGDRGRMSCVLCGVNTYSEHVGAPNATACIPCEANTLSNKLGADSRDACIVVACGPGSARANGFSCVRCGPGTYATPIACAPCARGTWSNVTGASTCPQKCAAGTYGVREGAASAAAACAACPPGGTADAGSGYCRACPAGMVAVVAGPGAGAQCAPCVADDVCAPAAVFTMPASATVRSSALPAPAPAAAVAPAVSAFAADAAVTTLAGSIGGACLFGTLALFLGARYLPARGAQSVDMFSLDHWIVNGGVQQKRNTKRGGACTLAFGLCACGMVAIFVVQWVNGNVVENQSLVPASLVNDAIPAMVSSFSLQLVFLDGDAAACDARVREQLSTTGVRAAATVLLSPRMEQGCALRWTYSEASLDSIVTFAFALPSWFAQHVVWNMSCASGVGDVLQSGVGGSLHATSSARLVGDAEITVSGTATRLVGVSGATERVGLLLSYGSVPARIETDAGALLQATDSVRFQFHVVVCAVVEARACVTQALASWVCAQMQTVVVKTVLTTRQSWVQLLSAVAGAIVALLGVFRFAFTQGERALEVASVPAAPLADVPAVRSSAIHAPNPATAVLPLARPLAGAHGVSQAGRSSVLLGQPAASNASDTFTPNPMYADVRR